MAIKIFQMNDTDWIAAENLDDAKQCFAEMMGERLTEEFEREYMEEPHALSEAAMDRLTIIDEDKPSTARTFREELQAMIDGGTKFPEYFCTTEY